MMKHLVLFFNSYFSTTFVEDSKKKLAFSFFAVSVLLFYLPKLILGP